MQCINKLYLFCHGMGWIWLLGQKLANCVEGAMNQQVYRCVLLWNLLPWARATFQNNLSWSKIMLHPTQPEPLGIFPKNQDMVPSHGLAIQKSRYEPHRTPLEPDDGSYPWDVKSSHYGNTIACGWVSLGSVRFTVRYQLYPAGIHCDITSGSTHQWMYVLYGIQTRYEWIIVTCYMLGICSMDDRSQFRLSHNALTLTSGKNMLVKLSKFHMKIGPASSESWKIYQWCGRGDNTPPMVFAVCIYNLL